MLSLQVATPENRWAALRLVLAPAPGQRSVAEVARTAADRAADPDAWRGLFVALRDGRLVGAVWVEPQPGGTASVHPPRLVADETPSTAAALLSTALDWLARRGTRLAQALLETDAGADAQELREAGFHHAADLLYLVSQAAAFPESLPQSSLEFLPLDPRQRQRMARVVERTYEGTLDCPELNGVRQINDVLAGYQSVGVFDPQLWLLARAADRDVGCLLIADHPATEQFEIVYMGLVPEARGNGWGVELVRAAQWLAKRAGRKQLVLAVDASNAPAIAAYAAAGLVAFDRRSVFLRVLDEGPPGT